MPLENQIVGTLPTQIPYQQLLRWENLAALVVIYYICIVIYRLYFGPLSHIPGRKLAGKLLNFLTLLSKKLPETRVSALSVIFDIMESISDQFGLAATSLYAMYHDLIRGGQYNWQIENMHQKYGRDLPSPALSLLISLPRSNNPHRPRGSPHQRPFIHRCRLRRPRPPSRKRPTHHQRTRLLTNRNRNSGSRSS